MTRQGNVQQVRRRATKKTRKTMDVILVLMGIFLVTFTIAMIVVFTRVGSEPSTLIGCVFAACTAEGGFMAMIKRSKTKNENSAPAEPTRKDPASGEGAEKEIIGQAIGKISNNTGRAFLATALRRCRQ